MTLIGYWVSCDDAQCCDCYQRSGGLDGWLADGGFEGWDEPIAIHDVGDPSDSPTHCCDCEALIAHELTSDGLDYVAETIEDAICNPGDHRRCIVRQWAAEYGAAAEVDPGLLEQAARWPDHDASSPTPPAWEAGQ